MIGDVSTMEIKCDLFFQWLCTGEDLKRRPKLSGQAWQNNSVRVHMCIELPVKNSVRVHMCIELP